MWLTILIAEFIFIYLMHGWDKYFCWRSSWNKNEIFWEILTEENAEAISRLHINIFIFVWQVYYYDLLVDICYIEWLLKNTQPT